jgi:hypothetical protein
MAPTELSALGPTPGAITEPETPPAALPCPLCSRLLTYQLTIVQGIRRERCDLYECQRCGIEYGFRCRTRTLKRNRRSLRHFRRADD